MSTYINKRVKARKSHQDDGEPFFDFLIKDGKLDKKECEEYMLEPDDVKTIQASIDRKWIIPKGEVHVYQVGRYDGESYVMRMSEAIYQLCIEFDLFAD